MPSNVPNFDELFAGCHESAVHLEMRDVYSIAAEAPNFAKWKEHGTRPAEAGSHPWFDLVRDAVGRGVVMRRARIVSEPVSEYIRYEFAGTYLNAEAGELVRWLPRRRASDLALPGNDFWIFDGRLVRFGHFSGDGEVVGPELNDDPAVVKLCSSAFEAVWDRAIPHEKYQV